MATQSSFRMLFVLLLGLVGSCLAHPSSPTNIEATVFPYNPCVVHIVLFGFKADASPEAIEKAYNQLLCLKQNAIHPVTHRPYIKSMTGGKNNSPEGLEDGAQYGFVAEFESLTDRDYYVFKDPAHQAFKKDAGPIIEKTIVIDYCKGVF